MGIRMHQAICLLLLLCSAATPMAGLATAQQPDIVQEHWYHSYLTLTADVQSWEADYPDIVNLVSAGTTLHGRQQWVVQISDWSMDSKADGTAKEMVYIDGGHHGNEHLGTELAFLTAEFYIEGWAAGDDGAVAVLQNTELHIMILLNADGNDLDSRWNMNQVDLNRNYDHHWTEEETASGDGPFSEPETSNNADYMAANMVDADLYVTMHTGTWILAYPWGFTGDMPSDYELYEHIRDTIHETIDADLPVRNANAGIYPTHGTSRDYGYGIMGYPTFTFETDDEQFLLGTTQALSDRLSVELDVMKYLIENVWYWRARLNVTSLEVGPNSVNLDVANLGHASTANASLHYSDAEGKQLWHSSNFSVNASNSTKVELSSENLSLVEGGSFELHYQKRVIDSAQWVSEAIPETNLTYVTASDSVGALSPTMVLTLQLSTIPIFGAILTWIIHKARRLDQEQEEEVEGRWHTFAWTLGAAGAFGGVITGAWYLFSYHTRILGGAESLVVLHVGMIVVGMGIGATIYGTIADRIGKRKEMLIGTALVNIVLYLIHPFLGLIPFLIVSTLQGMSLGVARLLFSMVTEIFPDAKSESIGLMHAVTWAIASIAVLLMGKLYGNYGFWAVSGMSIICIVVAILCVLNIGSSLQAFVESKTIPKE
ncbi:MAG: M14 family zinc carboxypeptidase, partial [Pseudomonadales bacterium]|nr:M14 family zinc carboxypeptidase [Pseudomonadales bacterium]